MSGQSQAGSATRSARPDPARALLDRLTAVYPYVLVTDSRSRVLAASEGWIPLCGVDRRVLRGELRELIPKLPRPEESLSILSALRQDGFLLRAEVLLRDRFGAVLPVEVTIFPVLPEGAERPLYAIVARPEPALREEPTRHRVLDTSPGAVLAVDGRGFVAYANAAAAELAGVERRKLEGAPLAVLAADPAGARDLLARLGGEPGPEATVRLRRPGLEPLEVAVSSSPLEPGDELQGCVLTLRPVGPEHELERTLTRRNQELEHCVNTLAHDLRSPLVALLGFSRLLRQDFGKRLMETGNHFLDRIEQSGRTMEALIHDLLELARIGQPGERPDLVNPRLVVLQLASEQKLRLEEAGLQIVPPEDPPLIYCDRTRLYQVFSNLVGNAIEHAGECPDPRVTVEITEEPGFNHVSVRDFGRGIDPKHHDRIFEVFQTLGTRRDGRRGTGIGLAIVRKIAETHGGRAWVESRPGEGATFHVTFRRQ